MAEDTTEEGLPILKKKQDTSVTEEGLPILKKKEPTQSASPLESSSPSENTTSPSMIGASAPQGLPTINEGINPPGVLTQPTQQLPTLQKPTTPIQGTNKVPNTFDFKEGKVIPGFEWKPEQVKMEPQGLSAATAPTSQTAGDVNTTGGKSFEQTNVGKLADATLNNDYSKSFLKGTASLGASLARTPAFLADITNRTINTINPTDKGMLPTDASTINNPIANSLEGATKNLGKEIDKENLDAEGNVISATDHFGKGEYAKGFDQLLKSVSEAMPTTLSLMAGNMAGASSKALAIGTTPVFAAGEKQSLTENNPGMSEEEKNNVSLISGALEGVTESMFGNVKLGSIYKGLLTKGGKEEAKKVIGEGVKSVYKKALGPYVGNIAEEMASEMSNQYLNNLNHIYVGGDTNTKPFDGVMEAGLVAIGSSGTMGAPTIALNVARHKSDVKKAQAIKEQQDNLKKELSNPDITHETRQSIVDNLHALNAEEDAHVKEMQDKHEKLPPAKKEEVDAILKKNGELATAALDPNLSPTAKEALVAQMDKHDKVVEDIYKENEKQLQVNEKNGITADINVDEHKDHEAKALADLKEEIKKEQEAEKLKKEQDAIQEQKTGGVLQRQQEEAGKPGGKRSGVEQGEQGQETPNARVQEEKITVGNKSFIPKMEQGLLVFHDDKGNVVRERHPSGGTNKRHEEILSEYRKSYDFTQGETADISDVDPSANVDDIENEMIDKSSSPLELAEVFHRNKENRQATDATNVDEAIRDNLKKINRDSYIRFGDRKKISMQMAQSWFKKSGDHIDKVATYLSDITGVEVTPQDIVDYIESHPSGHPSAKKIKGEAVIADRAAKKFKEITGFNLDEKTAEEIIAKESKNLNVQANEQHIDGLTDSEIEQLLSERELSEAEAAKIYEEEPTGEVAKTEGAINAEEKAAAEVAKSKEPDYVVENGDKITATVGDKEIKGIVTGVAKHKGQIVVDLVDENGDERFVYAHQINDMQKGAKQLPETDNFTKEQRSRFKELLAKLVKGDDFSAQEMDEFKVLSDIKSNKEEKQKPTNTLIDEEEQQAEASKDDDAIVQNLEDNITSLKKSSFPETKHRLFIGRVQSMMDSKEISKSTGNLFIKIADQVLAGKMGKTPQEIKTARKEENRGIAKKVGDAILNPLKNKDGEGPIKNSYPGVDEAIRKLLTYGADVVTLMQNAGYDVNRAVEKAIEKIKEHPLYKSLVTAKLLDEKQFEKDVRKEFKKEPVEEPEIIRQQTDNNFADDEDLSPENKVRAVFKNFLNSVAKDGLKNAVKELGVEYTVARMKETDETVSKIIAEAEKSGAMEDLEKMVLDKNSNMNMYDRGALAIKLAKINSDAWNDATNDNEKAAAQEKFTQLYKVAAESATLAGQTANYVGKVNKMLFDADPLLVVTSIKEGVAEQVEKLIGKKAKKLDKTAGDIEEAYTKKPKPVDDRIKKIREKRKDLFNKLKNIPLNSSKNGVTKLSTAPITDEHVKVLAEIALNYIDEGVVHLSSLVKNIRKDFFDAFGEYISKSDVEKVLAQKQGDKTIREISEKKSAERKKETDSAVETAFQKAKREHEEKHGKDKFTTKTKAEKVVKTVEEAMKESSKEMGEIASENKKVNTTPAPKGDIEATKKIIDEVISKDDNLSDLAKEQLAKDVMHHLDINGEMKPSDFKVYYGNALGISKFGPSEQQAVEKALEVIRDVDKIARLQEAQIKQLQALQAQLKAPGATPAATAATQASINVLNAKIKNTVRQFFAAQTAAQYANSAISKHFKNFNPYQLAASNLQLNLLTTASVINNIVAYLPTAPVRFARNTIAAGLDQVRYKLAYTALGEKLNLEKARNWKRGQELKLGYQYGFWNGLVKSWEATKHGNVDASFQDRNTAYEYNAPMRFKEAWDILKDKQINKRYAKAALKAGEATLTFSPDFMSRLLTWGDMPTKEKNRVAAAVALAAKEGLEGGALLKYVFNPTDEQAEKISSEAERSSYQNENYVSNGLNTAISKVIDKLEEQGGAGYHAGGIMRVAKAAIIPFTKTPTNLIDELSEMMFPVYSIPKAMVFAQKGDTRRAEQIMGNAVIGAALMGIAFKMFASGLLRPTSDEEDKKEKDILYAAGGKPGEINLSALERMFSSPNDWSKKRDSDTWISYEKLGTPGMLMGTMANYYDRQEVDGINIQETNLIADMFRAMPVALSTALNQSFLKNANDIQTAVNDKTGNKLNRFYTGEIGALMAVVYPNWVGSVSLSSQDYIKDRTTFKGFEQQLKFDLKQKFFSADDLPNKIDVFGRPVKRTPDESNRYVYYMLNPTKSHGINTKSPEYKLFDFFTNLPQSDKDRFSAVPNQPSNEVEGQLLSGDNYEKYQKEVGKYRYQMLSMYAQSPNWHTDTPAEKIDWLKTIWVEGQKDGKEEFLQSHEQFRKPDKTDEEIDKETEFKESRSDLKSQIEELKPNREE